MASAKERAERAEALVRRVRGLLQGLPRVAAEGSASLLRVAGEEDRGADLRDAAQDLATAVSLLDGWAMAHGIDVEER